MQRFQPGHDHPHHGDVHVWPRQVHDHDLVDGDLDEPSTGPRDVVGTRRGVVRRHLGERSCRRRVDDLAQRASNHIGMPDPLEERPIAVVSRPGDVREAALRRLGERAQQRDAACRVRTAAVHGIQLPEHIRMAVGHDAPERGDADVSGRVPDRDGEVGGGEETQHLLAIGVVDRGEGDPSRRAGVGARGEPQRVGITLHDFTDAVDDGFERVIAGGKAVRTHDERPAARRERQREVRVHHLVWHPHRTASDQVVALGPEQRLVRMERADRELRQAGDVDHRAGVLQFGPGGVDERHRHVLGMPRLDRLHDAGGTRGVEIEALALRHGQGPGIRAVDRDDRQADVIESGDDADPCDARPLHHGCDAGQGLRRRNDTMGTARAPLGRRAGVAVRQVHARDRSSRRGLLRGVFFALLREASLR